MSNYYYHLKHKLIKQLILYKETKLKMLFNLVSYGSFTKKEGKIKLNFKLIG